MRVRVKHKSDPAATFSGAVTEPDSEGGFYIDHSNLSTAQSFGFVVAHEPEPAPAPEEPVEPAPEEPRKRGRR